MRSFQSISGSCRRLSSTINGLFRRALASRNNSRLSRRALAGAASAAPALVPPNTELQNQEYDELENDPQDELSALSGTVSRSSSPGATATAGIGRAQNWNARIQRAAVEAGMEAVFLMNIAYHFEGGGTTSSWPASSAFPADSSRHWPPGSPTSTR